jgi:surface antigen
MRCTDQAYFLSQYGVREFFATGETIRISTSLQSTAAARLGKRRTLRESRLYKRMQLRLRRKSTRRRSVRIGLITANVVILAIVVVFVAQNPSSASETKSAALSSTQPSAVVNPLDQLSSADIALTVARMSSLPEATAVSNQAESQAADLTSATSNGAVLEKPQVVSTALKSKADIKTYVTKPGDTLGTLAAQFGVTSNSIRWSNGLSSDTITAGTKLVIPPVPGIVYIVKAGDTPTSLATKYSANKDKIIAYNDAEISGLYVGERIIIPDGSPPVPVVSVTNYLSWGGSASYGSNGYDPGWCTWYAASRRAQLGHPVPSNLGNAYTWAIRAAAFGMSVGSTPQKGAVMVNQSHDHVAVVEQVNADGSYWISEMNSYGQVSMTNSTPTGGLYRVDWKVIPAANAGYYRYIY